MTTPFDQIGPQQEQSALGDITKMLTGTKQLRDEPGLVYSLAQARAHPADAGAIDAFMQGLEVEKRVNIAGTTGAKIPLTMQDKSLLDSMGVAYDNVEFTYDDQLKAQATAIASQSNGTLKAKTDAQGNYVLDKTGHVMAGAVYDQGIQQVEQKDHSFVGTLWNTLQDHVVNPVVDDVLDPTFTTLSKGYNWAATDLSRFAHSIAGAGEDIASGPQGPQQGARDGGGNVGGASQQLSASIRKDMLAQGYDPDNPFSIFAFDSSGHAHNDLTGLERQWDASNPAGYLGLNGEQAVAEAAKFMSDPKAYQRAIENDPSNFARVDGQTVVTQAGKAKLDLLKDKNFIKLAVDVNSRTATIGNDTMNALGVDANKHPTYYAIGAAGFNLAAAFAIDPTMALLGGAKVARMYTIGIDSLADAQGALRVLDPALGSNSVQRGWQRAIDLSSQIREAHLGGDAGKASRLSHQFSTELPGLSPILDDFVGVNALVKWSDKGPVLGETGGIRSLADAAEYVGSKLGMLRLMGTKAAQQSTIMPGALSRFGYRRLKGLTAGWMTTRAVARNEKNYGKFVDFHTADPGRLTKAIDDGLLEQFTPHADNAVDFHTDSVLADKNIESLGHDTKVTLDDLNSRLKNVEQFGAADAGAVKATSGQLDDLEERLQSLMADKGSYASANPDLLAALHDRITEGRASLETLETSSKAADAAGKAILDQGMAQADTLNPTQISRVQHGNLPAYKDPLSGGYEYRITPMGRGRVQRNLRTSGSPTRDGDWKNAVGWSTPTAFAERARLAATRLSSMLPRNTVMAIDDPTTGDKLYKYALTYLNHADANSIRVAYSMGTGGERKAIITGMMDQIAEAAGLSRTETGSNLMRDVRTMMESYSSTGQEILLDGQNLAMHGGQIRTHWTLPDFRLLQKGSAKFGLWEATFGRAMTSRQADSLMTQWKLGALAKPSTVTRNQLEAGLNVALQGKLGASLKARALATTPNRELWDRGLNLETKDLYDTLVSDSVGLTGKALKAKLKEAEDVARGTMMSGEVLGRGAFAKRAAEFYPFAVLGRYYRHILNRDISSDELKVIAELGQEDLGYAMEGYAQQVREGDLGLRNGARQAHDVSKAGFGPSLMRMYVRDAMAKGGKPATKSTEWQKVEVNDLLGMERYANALAVRANVTPSVARAAIDHLEDPAQYTIDHVVAAMDAPEMAQTARLMGWGRVTWDDIEGPARRAMSESEKLSGKQEWAKRIVSDYRHLLTGRNGEYQKALAKEIHTTGRAPDVDWLLAHVTGDHRPESVMAPVTEAMPNGGIKSIAQTLQDLEGSAYTWLVERPLQRTVSGPVFLANYAESRVALTPVVKRLVEEHGLTQVGAENLAKDLAIRQSWIKTEQMIDDPGQRTQFDIIARNMFPFARATQAMVRRWGSTFWQDPVRARKMMLAYEGGVHSGLIYDNAYGEPTFTYPGSGVMNMAMRGLSEIPGFESFSQFPMSASMTGQVFMSVPGADNPFRMSMGPMLSVPMRELFGLFPKHRAVLDEIDAAINGPIGVGETWTQATPTIARKVFALMNDDQRNSALASATAGAIANLVAAGQMPPKGAGPEQLAQWVASIEAQVRNQLYLRTAFGLFAPAAPGLVDSTSGSSADWAFHVRGIGQLNDEYKTILNDVDGDVFRATAIWTAMHPDKLVYTIAHSRSTSSKAYVPATSNALNWMEANGDFISKYQSVAAYFLPSSASAGGFNDRAYNTSLELKLREKKTPNEFLTEVLNRSAESEYYPAVRALNDEIAQLKADGNASAAAALEAGKQDWTNKLYARYPTFKYKRQDFDHARAMADAQVKTLELMVTNGQVPNGQSKLLSQLLANYKGYDDFVHSHPGLDKTTQAMHRGALALLNDWAQKHLPGSELADLWQGVFRTLNTNLVNLNSVGS